MFPDSPLLGFFEFFFREGADAEFDPAFPPRAVDAHRIRIKNDVLLQSFALCDWGVTPTYWQLAQFPEHWRDRISVIFDGVDTKALAPNPDIRMHVTNPSSRAPAR